jgi:hypothetical protein
MIALPSAVNQAPDSAPGKLWNALIGAPVRVSHRYKPNIPPAVAMVFPSGLKAITPVTNGGTGSAGPGPAASDQRNTESPQPFTANRRPSGLIAMRSVERARVPGRITGSASRYERSLKRPLSAVESRPSSPTKKSLPMKSVPRSNSASFFPVFIDHTMVEYRLVVASMVPRLLNASSLVAELELMDSTPVKLWGPLSGGSLARSLATAALSLSCSEKTLFTSRGRHTRTIPSLPPTASSWPSSEKTIGP